ncbi:MAG: dockerin type I domain-containing protein, partial [Acutalibacteraceae bacterium]|nr:dockerin type I domain-containing protein [Acutalibacteraceae bacterium]
ATRFGSQTDDMTIQLIKSGESEAAYEAIVKGDATGYSIAGVLPGTYTMKVSKKNHVTREYTVTVGSSNVVQDVEIWLLGDLNGDGKINLLDLITMRKYLAKWSISIDETVADCNADGKVNLLDLILMRKYLAKWSVSFGPQK